MRKTNTITEFHPDAPKKLIRLYKKCGGNCYITSKSIGVNPGQVWQLLKKGKQPKRDDIRRKMFLPHKKTKEELAQQRANVPEFLKAWNRLSKEERHKVIQQYLNWRNKNGSNQKKDTA